MTDHDKASVLNWAAFRLRALGRAWLLNGLDLENKDRNGAFKKANEYLDQAVDGLRKSGNQDDLPRGLLARAAYYRTRQQYDLAEQDLAEALEIAELGSMKLYLVDYHLESGRLHAPRAAPLSPCKSFYLNHSRKTHECKR